MNPPLDRPMDQNNSKLACTKCKRAKTKCDRLESCSRCREKNLLCVYNQKTKQPPVKRKHFDKALCRAERLERDKKGLQDEIEALETELEDLKAQISKIAIASPPQRDALLADLVPRPKQRSPPNQVVDGRSFSVPLRIIRDCPPRKIVGPIESWVPEQSASPSFGDMSIGPSYSKSYEYLENFPHQQYFAPGLQPSSFSPRNQQCRDLIKIFFDKQYQYHMALYREFFLRDYDIGIGPYYSDLLMFAICAIGALAKDEGDSRAESDIFSNQAQQILWGSALDKPSLTTVQALLLLGHREIGLGNMSKGWMLSRMAFALAHEMGLHLDPNNWELPDLHDQEDAISRRRDREILRRTYWAAFIADKQLSLYFGRPPALDPSQADVHDTTRITYPPGWKDLLNKYIKPDSSIKEISETTYEDGKNLVAFWIAQIELSKISHRMIVEVFENRSAKVGEDCLAASIEDIHLALLNWQQNLVDDLHWSQTSKQKDVPRLVLYLYLLYHTTMIILHRPSRKIFQDASIAANEDINICYESVDEIVALLRTHSQHHPFKHLPFNMVYILATAASILLMRRHLIKLPWHDDTIQKPLTVIEKTLNNISRTWSCAKQVLAVIRAAKARPMGIDTQCEATYDFDSMTGIQMNNNIFQNEVFGHANVSEGASSICDGSSEIFSAENSSYSDIYCNRRNNYVPDSYSQSLDANYFESTTTEGVGSEQSSNTGSMTSNSHFQALRRPHIATTVDDEIYNDLYVEEDLGRFSGDYIDSDHTQHVTVQWAVSSSGTAEGSV